MFSDTSWKWLSVPLSAVLKSCGPKDWTKGLSHAVQVLYHWVMSLPIHLSWGGEEGNQDQCDTKEDQRSHEVWGAAGDFQNLVREYSYRSLPSAMLPRGNFSAIGRQELWNPFPWIYKSFKCFTSVKSGDPASCCSFCLCVCFLLLLLFWKKLSKDSFPICPSWVAWSIHSYSQFERFWELPSIFKFENLLIWT